MSRPSLRLGSDGVELVTLGHHHIGELAELRTANADDIRATSGARHLGGLNVEEMARSLQLRIDSAPPDLYPFVIISEGRMAGELNLSQVVRGSEGSANVGLLVDRAHHLLFQKLAP